MHQVQDVMTGEVVAIDADATVDEAISLLLENSVSGLPVVDGQGRLLGVFSEVDIIDLVYNADIENSTIGDHMTRDVRWLDAEASLDDAAGIFCEKSIRRIPIVRDGKLVGILSRRDLIGFVRDVRREVATV